MVHVFVLTGAGISADSGLATFRGAGGLWEGRRVEEVATPQAWAREPEMVWSFYQLRRSALVTVEPNPAHHALVRLERELGLRGHGFTLVTQNVDELHERAGSTNWAMHGSLAWLRCEACGERAHDLEHLDPKRFVPCSACGHERLRPDVVWFGEMPRFLEEIEVALSSCSHFLAVGTSGFVYPAAGMLSAAREVGALTFVNSLDEPENLHSRDEFLPGRASQTVPALVEEWLGRFS